MANKIIYLGNHPIGDGHEPLMIAEIGINHNGSLEITKKLIDAAFSCNWHCVKFQKRSPDLCVPEGQKHLPRVSPWGTMPYIEYKRRMEFGYDEYSFIDRYCREKPIFWSSSVWDIPSVEFINQFKVPFLKIPSAKLTDLDLLKQSCETKKPILLSTGMSTVEEIDHAVNILEKHSHGEYVLLHTNAAYPAPHNELNLRVIPYLRERYKCVVGYSGHEQDLEPTVLAVSLGACVIERHITLDHTFWGTDHSASLEIHGMDILKRRIKDVNLMLGDGIKRVTKSEIEAKARLRG